MTRTSQQECRGILEFHSFIAHYKKLWTSARAFICVSDEPKSELALDLGDRIQSQNVPAGTSDDCHRFLFNSVLVLSPYRFSKNFFPIPV